MIAICQIRPLPHYRREAFVNGLKRLGYSIVNSGRPKSRADFLVLWNRYGPYAAMADAWERDGGTVLVCENGYIGKDEKGLQYYAISAKGHNGSGVWPSTQYDRWKQLNIECKPWRQADPEGHLLVCGQRGIGSTLMASPPDWHKNVQKRIVVATKRPIKVRLHPGDKPAATKLEDDLRGAHACLVWSSSSGVKALVEGYPVFYDAPYWICEGAALRIKGGEFERPICSDTQRLAALERMAWAQWSIAEIEAGIPFDLFQNMVKEPA